ncbi:MAG: hypothetical protein IJX65_02780 [Alistipes sp.]|nr:hypothetical protein [Alistipes sp.]
MKNFNFNRFKTFALKHYSEYGRNYKISMLILLGVWGIIAIMKHSGMMEEDMLNIKQVVTLATLIGMLSNITSSSMGSLDRKNNIIDLTLPVTTLERFVFVLLNSFVLGVVVPTFVLDIPAQQLIPTLCTMIMAHAALMAVACWGNKRGYSYLVIAFFAVVIGITSLFEQIDIFISYGYGKFFSLLPNDWAVYMSNIYETDGLVYRWDLLTTIPAWVHLAFNGAITVGLYIVSFLKLRERQL